MSFSDADLARLLVAIGLLLGSATTFAHLFAKVRQPPVIGEILGGIVLGPTLLGALWPSAEAWIFPKDGPVPATLGALYQLGLLLLMFASGAQMATLVRRSSARAVITITTIGMLVPFAAGLGLVALLDTGGLEGSARNGDALVLVFGIAVAVTSIPVISRIMHDLGLLDTRFAQIVLGVAILEDVVLYVVLAIALGLVGGTGGSFGLAHALGITSLGGRSLYHTAAAVTFLVLGALVAPRLSRRALRHKLNVVGRRSPIAFQLLWMLAFSLIALLLGLVPMFGAFIAGIATAGDRHEGAKEARREISAFAFAMLIPLYFAVVGFKLDLLHDFSPLFFLGFLAFACAVKGASVLGSARLAGERPRSARDLAVALNARGGPGIVLASTAFDAGIIDRSFFATLVLLAVVTSLLAGFWLDRVAAGIRADEAGPGAAPAEPAAA